MDPELTTDKGEEEKSSLKQIRTYQGDVAEALKRQRESLISIQRAEAVKRGGQASSASLEELKKRREFLLLLLGSALLIGIGALGAWLGYMQYKRGQIAPLGEAPASQLVSPTSKVEIVVSAANITREAMLGKIFEAKGNVGPNEIKHIILKDELRKSLSTDIRDRSVLTIVEFFNILGSKAPGSLLRAFEPEFMLGANSIGGVGTFLIMRTPSFEHAFAGMLDWEKDMKQDIGSIFNTYTLMRELPMETPFRDLTDRNKDIRALYYGEAPILMYTFVENESLIITDSLETLRTIVERMTREKLSR